MSFSYVTCSQVKLFIWPTLVKIRFKSPKFLEGIQGDTCGPFRYFMILIAASMKWSHVCLLSSCNLDFPRLLMQVIWSKAQFPNNPIICLDDASEFTSQAFNAYYMANDINVEHLIAYVHTQNGLTKSIIKCL